MQALPHVRGPMRREILAFVSKNPGCTSNEVMGGLRKAHMHATVGGALCDLHAEGLLTRQRKGRYFRYMLRETALSEAEASATSTSPDLLVEHWRKVAQQRMDALREARHELEVLTTWKNDAIARFPELDEDPLLQRARNVVAMLHRSRPNATEDTIAFSHRIEAGEYDMLVEVQAALAALRGGIRVKGVLDIVWGCIGLCTFMFIMWCAMVMLP